MQLLKIRHNLGKLLFGKTTNVSDLLYYRYLFHRIKETRRKHSISYKVQSCVAINFQESDMHPDNKYFDYTPKFADLARLYPETFGKYVTYRQNHRTPKSLIAFEQSKDEKEEKTTESSEAVEDNITSEDNQIQNDFFGSEVYSTNKGVKSINEEDRIGLFVDWKDPNMVRELTRTLLLHDFGIRYWSIPSTRLIPPLPNRLNYLCWINDLLNEIDSKASSETVFGLDIGTGSSVIFPILGTATHKNWFFVGSDIDYESIVNAEEIIKENSLDSRVKLKYVTKEHDYSGLESSLVTSMNNIFRKRGEQQSHSSMSTKDDEKIEIIQSLPGPILQAYGLETIVDIVRDYFTNITSYGQNCTSNDTQELDRSKILLNQFKSIQNELEEIRKLDFTVCNPPFYSSYEEIGKGKLKRNLADTEISLEGDNLEESEHLPIYLSLLPHAEEKEMICKGGEVSFISAMISDSIFIQLAILISRKMLDFRRVIEGDNNICFLPKKHDQDTKHDFSLNLNSTATWYTTMIGRKQNVKKVLGILKHLGIENVRQTAFVQGHIRRWGIAWRLDSIGLQALVTEKACSHFLKMKEDPENFTSDIKFQKNTKTSKIKIDKERQKENEKSGCLLSFSILKNDISNENEKSDLPLMVETNSSRKVAWNFYDTIIERIEKYMNNPRKATTTLIKTKLLGKGYLSGREDYFILEYLIYQSDNSQMEQDPSYYIDKESQLLSTIEQRQLSSSTKLNFLSRYASILCTSAFLEERSYWTSSATIVFLLDFHNQSTSQNWTDEINGNTFAKNKDDPEELSSALSPLKRRRLSCTTSTTTSRSSNFGPFATDVKDESSKITDNVESLIFRSGSFDPYERVNLQVQMTSGGGKALAWKILQGLEGEIKQNNRKWRRLLSQKGKETDHVTSHDNYNA